MGRHDQRIARRDDGLDEGTVEEAIAFLEDVDLRPLLSRAMLFFADASGDSVIIEGDKFLRNERFRQSWPAFDHNRQSRKI